MVGREDTEIYMAFKEKWNEETERRETEGTRIILGFYYELFNLIKATRTN